VSLLERHGILKGTSRFVLLTDSDVSFSYFFYFQFV